MTGDWVLRRMEREVRRRPITLAALAAAMALAAVVAGVGVLGQRTARALVPRLEHNVHVIAYLGDGLGPAERDRLLEALRRIPGVERARLVEPEEALARLRKAAESLGGAPALAAVEPGFLPRSVEIAVAAGAEMPARTAELAARLRTLPGVVEVDAMSAGLARLLSWIELGRRLCLAALVLAALGAAAALALAVLSGRERRRREAAVLSLLGESPSGIRLPVSMATAAAALLGAALGVIALVAIFPSALVAVAAALVAGPVAVPSIGAGEVAAALVMAAALGWIAGRFAAPVVEGAGEA